MNSLKVFPPFQFKQGNVKESICKGEVQTIKYYLFANILHFLGKKYSC